MTEFSIEAEEGGKALTDDAFLFGLKALLVEAKKRKEAEPKSNKTRFWAVIHTQLENTFAYFLTYLGD